MPRKKVNFQIGEFYHIYNRGTDKREIFSDIYDHERFLLSLKEFNNIEPTGSLRLVKIRKEFTGESNENSDNRCPTPEASGVGHLLVEIIAYSLLPNHFHLLLKQKVENGVSEFMKRIGGGYTNYYNKKHNRSGSLFQGKFKAVHIDSQNYLEYIYLGTLTEIQRFIK